MKRYTHTLFAVCLSACVAIPTSAQRSPSAIRCESLQGRRFLNDSITKADWVSAGTLSVPGTRPGATLELHLPEHCAIEVISTPFPDSHIVITLWLPASESWNHKMLGTGNGGYSSSLSYIDMADGLAQSYVVGGSDTGHTGDGLQFGDGHVEKIKDWAYRATHELATAESWVASQFYGERPRHAYFRGCSTGGQQGLSEAQRYPSDFDGILAGDPGNDRILLNADFVASWLVAHPPNAPAFPHAKLALLAEAAMNACDLNDGLEDGIISNPIECHFDPQRLSCKEGESTDACLTSNEVETAEALYAGPVRDNGKPIYFGWPRGSELGWGAYVVDPKEPVRVEFWKDWVFKGRSFDTRQFQAGQAIAAARSKLPFAEAMNTDLSAFAQRGGKLLMYHGWADPVVPPEDSIAYFKAVRSRVKGDFLQLFMVPGMSHCGGGTGPNQFDALDTLDAWVTSGSPPNNIMAKRIENGNTVANRPLCPFPKEAAWDGKNNPSLASSFSCK